MHLKKHMSGFLTEALLIKVKINTGHAMYIW